MKKLCAILLAAMALLAGVALADTTVARSGALAAYLDGAGGLYLPGNDDPVNTAEADALISIDPYRVLFLSELDDGDHDLYMIDLGDFSETRVSTGVYTACADGDALYYVPSADRTQLYRVDLEVLKSAPLYTAAEPIDRLQATAEGLVLELVDGAGAMLHVDLTDSFEVFLSDVPRQSILTDDYEVYLSGTDLYLKDTASYTAEYIDSGVQDFTVMGGVVYYVGSGGSAMQLKSYSPATTSWQTLMPLDVSVERQITSTGEALFMIDLSRQVYSVDLANKRLSPFAKVPGDSNYAIPSGFEVNRLRLEGMTGQLNVYAELEEASAQPDFSFIEFTSASDALEPKVMLLETFAIDGEDPAWTALKPAPQYSPLARGSRGDAVSAIQVPLYDLGYYDYYIDGIFGPRTEAAVRMVQADLNRTVTGIADSELQRMLLDGQVPHFDAYMALTRGNRGLRVQVMQERLRDLGYLADFADGIFGANTQRAVQLFQSENGLSVSDGATRQTLKLLYSDEAESCSSYIDLYPGNTGSRVRALNNRLRDLYYLSDNPGSAYTKETAEAVRSYQRTAGLRVTGIATADVQRRLFSRYAPEAPGYITLRRGDDNDRVGSLQRRLRELNYYTGAIDGYFGRATEKAVELFQKKVGLSATGVANVRTQELLFRKDAPEYVKPTVISDPVIVPDCYYEYKKGVYTIADSSTDTGYITFNWYVEGEAESYRVRIRDEKKRTYVDEDTYLSRTGFSLYTLEYDKLYTLTVTAYPEDGDSKHITSASVSFMRIEDPIQPEPEPPVAVIGDPEITLATVTRVQDGIHYVAPGQVTLRWHAEGNVDSYAIEVLDSDGDTWLSKATVSEAISVKSSSMAVGEVYTLLVYAIPRNGTIENATVAADFFALEDISVPTPSPEPENWDALPIEVIEEKAEATPEPAPEAEELPKAEAIPEPEATPAPTAEIMDEAEVVDIPEVIATPEPAVEAEEIPEVTPTPEPPVEEAPVITLAPEADVTPKEVAPEAVEAVEPEPEVAEPEPEIVEPEPEIAEPEVAEAEPEIAEPEPEVEVPTVSVPELSFETVLDQDENITYLADAPVTLYWHSEGDVEGYYVEILDDQGNQLAHTTTDKGNLSIKRGNFQPDQVYTLRVTALPVGGELADGVTATALLALYPVEDEAEVIAEAPTQEPVIEETVDEAAYEAPKAEEQVEAYPQEEYEEYAEAYPEDHSDDHTEDYSEEGYEDHPDDYTEDYSEEGYDDYTEEYSEEYADDDYEEYAEESAEDYADAPETGEDPWAQPLTAASDSALIGQVQTRLVTLGWLAPDSYEAGTLDEATLQAVRDFQARCNEVFGGELIPVETTIPAETLQALMLGEDVTP